MRSLMNTLGNEIVFWMAWVIIPLIMEIIPAFFGIFLLFFKRIRHRKEKELVYFPEITLIIPVYNSADTLEGCLESVYHSTYPNSAITVMLVDNGSKDNSFSVYQEYQERHPDMNTKWMNAKQGKSRALNMALFHSDGKYIIHIDSDGRLHEDALMNMVRRFESDEKISCMTGSILTDPEAIQKETGFWKRILQKTEFFEYAQAFLAGRNYEAEINSIFTLSGAFSAFRKSTILKTQLYNTETVCEDTHVTFQIRYNLKKKIDICENAVFFVEPIESLGKLYVQRQRWQRGELEVIHMFRKQRKRKFSSSGIMSKMLIFDHTFAFPRMIWYMALLCLSLIGYPFRYVAISFILIYILYVISAFFYYINVCLFLKWDKELQRFYRKKVGYVLLLPMLNFLAYWFRLAGIINSIKGTSSWRTKGFDEEVAVAREIIKQDFSGVARGIQKVKEMIYKDEKNEKENK
ncbi:MAG: putative glycosyltransferase, exosortase G system-associated [Lachnospiraceae bacterium]|nr:putative glycosyltransferase, exosortase G system-associated [Lachnospiraceae bacterium]